MPRYAIQYEQFDDPEWSTETHMIDADEVSIDGGIAHFRNSETDEAFLIAADNLIAAWTHGDE